MKNCIVRKLGAVLLPVVASVTVGCGAGGGVSDANTGVSIIMDTYVSYNIAPSFGNKYDIVYEDLTEKGNRLEKDYLSRHEAESEISKINASAGSTDGYPLSEKMEEYLTTCLELSEETEGAFDISLGALIDLWNIDEAARNEETNGDDFEVPAGGLIKETKELCGYEKIRIDNHRIYIPKGMILDLGAVGKGILLDEYARESKQIKNGFISAGGSVITFGVKDGGGTWNVGIKDPRSDGYEPATVLKLPGETVVSTSGDYERYIFKDGVRYHHILNPGSGWPADSKLASVTVCLNGGENSGLISDALSTAIFVLGENKGKALADKYKAFIILIRGDGQMITYGGDYIKK